MSHDVFISYANRDKAVADAVCAALEERRIRCWYAPRDVPPGHAWASALVDAIGQSRVFILIFSDGANRSGQVAREMSLAAEHELPILPFRIEDVEPSGDMRYYIQSIHWLDALTPPLERHLATLTETVAVLLSLPRVGRAGPPPAAAPGTARGMRPEPSSPVAARRRLPAWAAAVVALLLFAVTAGAVWWASGRPRGAGTESGPEATRASATAPVTAGQVAPSATKTPAAGALPGMTVAETPEPTSTDTRLPTVVTVVPEPETATQPPPTQVAAQATPSTDLKVERGPVLDDGAKALDWSPDGRLLAVADFGTALYDMTTLDIVARLTGGHTWDVAFSPDGTLLATSHFGGLRLWDTATWGEIWMVEGNDTTWSVAFSADESTLVTATGGAVKVWDVASGEELRTIPSGGTLSAVAASPDGRWVAAPAGVAGNEVSLWDASEAVTAGLEPVAAILTLRGHASMIKALAFSLDSALLASGSADNTARLWEVEGGVQKLVLQKHTGEVTSLAFSSDGRFLATGSMDMTVRLWDVGTGASLATLAGHTGWVKAVAFSPDGLRLASGAGEGVRIWELVP